MTSALNIVGVELIVGEIDSALALFVDALGLELVERRSSADPVGEVAILAAGEIAITLLAPADHGPGFVLHEREPRLSQVVVSAPQQDLARLAENVTESGIPIQPADDGTFFVTPSGCQGTIGVKTAIVVTAAAG